MKANELRVGNWCKSPYEKEPFKIKAEHILQLEQGMDECSIVGIPLTPQILIKAGFIKYDWMDGYFIKTKFGDLMIQFLTHRVYLYFTNVGGDSQGMKMRGKRYVGNINTTQNITYLHQLQNLYFALTGKELTFDL
jgi:hypothetical protein